MELDQIVGVGADGDQGGGGLGGELQRVAVVHERALERQIAWIEVGRLRDRGGAQEIDRRLFAPGAAGIGIISPSGLVAIGPVRGVAMRGHGCGSVRLGRAAMGGLGGVAARVRGLRAAGSDEQRQHRGR